MMIAKIEKWIPGLKLIRTYKREWLSNDVIAGVSVAAVALPIGIAYAQLAGFPPVIGIYSCILPAIAYALFGSSRQLVVNPDSAAVMIFAATLLPIAGDDPQHYYDLSILLTIITGLLCLIGGAIGFGVIANFLSRPILTGYLNGIALSIMANQLGTLLGFKIPSTGFLRTVVAAASRINETQIVTLLLGLALFVLILFLKRISRKIPAPLIAALIGIGAIYFFNLQQYGVAVVGQVPAGFPAPHIPAAQTSDLLSLTMGAFGIVLVSFCSMMTTARGFAAKNGYQINANRDMFALGISDLASALNGGFVVSGADSRTAVADASGGKTQVATVVAAATMAIVLLFLTHPLAYLPTAALAAILIASAIGLFDIASLRKYYALSKPEFWLSVIAMVGVMSLGVLPGVLIAVGLAIFKLLQLASQPHDAVLGLVDKKHGLYDDVSDTDDGRIPGLLIYRFDSSLLFFNADYFKERVRQTIREEETKPEWFIFDTGTMPLVDVTGSGALQDIHKELANQGIVLVIAHAKGWCRAVLERTGIVEKLVHQQIFPTVHAAVQAYLDSKNISAETTPVR